MQDPIDCDIEMRVLENSGVEQEVDERRSGVRTDAGPSSAALWLKAKDKTWPLRSVRVLDISPGGLSFEADAPLPVGSMLEMNVNTPVKNGILVVARVQYAMEWAGSHRIGVKFTDISESDRKLLDGRTFRDISTRKRRRSMSRSKPDAWWEWENEPY